MSWRTSLAGLLAALSVLATLPDLPPMVRTIFIVVGAVAMAVLGAVSRDHAAPVLLPCDPVERVKLPIAKDAPSAEKGEP